MKRNITPRTLLPTTFATLPIVALLSLIFLATVLMPQTASALTLLGNGGEYDVGSPGDETQFVAYIIGAGGGGSWSATFDSTPVETTSLASAWIGDFVAGTFSGLTMSWVSLTNGTLDSISVTPGLTTLSTFFSSPGDLIQNLTLSWTGSMLGAGFSLEVGVPTGVVATPLPPSALLFLSALAGFAFLGWRRRVAS